MVRTTLADYLGCTRITRHNQETIMKPLLILGASGKTGRRIVEKLRARQVPVRLGSRGAHPAFDWSVPATWAAALDGVSAVYLSYYPDIAVPGAPEAIEAFSKLALASGVRRVVLLSGRGEAEARRAEQILQRSGADWTIVRCSWFMQNFDEGVFLESLLGGTVSLPVGAVGEPFVDADDIADVAVAALTEPGHVGKLYELTGPRLMTFAQAVEEISRASGRPIRFETVTMDAFARALVEQQQPAEIVEFLQYLFGEVLDGRNEYLADGVHRALGRAPRDFTDYAQRAAAAWGG